MEALGTLLSLSSPPARQVEHRLLPLVNVKGFEEKGILPAKRMHGIAKVACAVWLSPVLFRRL